MKLYSLTCDYLGRKTAIVFTTLMIVVGGILATASHGVTINGMFWMMTVARGIVGFGMRYHVVLPDCWRHTDLPRHWR